MGRIVWRGIAIWATPAALAVAVGCSNSSNSAALGSGDAAVTEAGEDAGANGHDGSIGAINELNADAEVTNGVMCGSMMCTPPMGGMFPLSACCLPNNGCGASLGSLGGAAGGATADGGGTCLNPAPGQADPSCPAIVAMGMSIPSCCSADGVCGSDLSIVGLGCNSLSVFGALGGGGEAGAPQSCGPGAGGSTVDSSVDAAVDAPSDAAVGASVDAAGE